MELSYRYTAHCIECDRKLDWHDKPNYIHALARVHVLSTKHAVLLGKETTLTMEVKGK
jgi:hypothetical protein